MYKGKYLTVLIAAGGAGTRFGAGDPKQFLDIGGRSMLTSSIEPFLLLGYVDEIVVTAPGTYIERACDLIIKELGAMWVHTKDGNQKLKISTREKDIFLYVVSGGIDRAASVRAGLDAAGKDNPEEGGLVLIHDAARPFVNTGLIERVIDAAYTYGAAVPAISVRDTVYFTDEYDFAETIPDRARLRAVQTPQGFALELIKKAHAAAVGEGLTVTDDGMPVLSTGERVALVEGCHENIKITIQEDIYTRKGLYAGSGMRVGIGYDAHRFEEGSALILGGIEIPFFKRLSGHSDADVVTHALIDAILGALSEGDIGMMFPDTDEKYAGISSILLLEEVVSLMEKLGYEVVNADLTLVAEWPRMTNYREKIELRLAGVLGIEPEDISLKATTTEKLGFTGREEGIAAEAVVLLKAKNADKGRQ